jgi:hypothetical protein
VNGKDYLRVIAREVEGCGWEVQEDFNVVEYNRATAAELFLLLQRASRIVACARRRNDKRFGRKLIHTLRNTLRDIGADPDEIEAAANSGVEDGEAEDVEAFSAIVLEAVERRRAEMALSAERLPTATRGPKVVLALSRALERLEAHGLSPIGRARGPVAAPARSPRRGRVVRADSASERATAEEGSEDDEDDPYEEPDDVLPGSGRGSRASDVESASSRVDVESLDERRGMKEDRQIRTRGTEPSPRTSRTRRGADDRDAPERDAGDGSAPLIGGLPDDGWDSIS